MKEAKMLTEKTFDTGIVSINYVEGPSSGIPLVLLHGATLRWQHFLPVLPYLSFRYHTYALDLRGPGRSSRAPGAYRNVDYAADIICFLRNQVVEPAVILGHSLGRSVAIQVAAEAPALIHAVVLEEPALYRSFAGTSPAHSVLPVWRSLAGTEVSLAEKVSTLAALDPNKDGASLRASAQAICLGLALVIARFYRVSAIAYAKPPWRILWAWWRRLCLPSNADIMTIPL
jgi:pimeloyl-ACP methyl ester carboxylesterase